MRKLINTILNVLLIFIGISLIIFVIRMVWLPPTSMGMMMDRTMMMHHISFWIQGTFFILLIFLEAALIFKWLLTKKNKTKE